MPAQQVPLVLVSNRGPVTFDADGETQRGSGGLVTALTGLASHREAIWIASAMNEYDAEVSREHGERAFPVRSPAGDASSTCAWSSPTPTPTTASTTSSPTRCCGSSSTTCGTCRTRRTSAARRSRRSSSATTPSTRTSRDAVVEELEGAEEPVVMVHDYHLYTLPDLVRRARPDAFLHHFIHIPWTQSDAWRVLPTRIREEIFTGLLANDIIGFHTRSYRRNFLQCCRDLMDLEVDFERGVVVRYGEREVWVRAYPLPIDHEATRRIAQRARVERVRAGAAAPPARLPDPARRPRRPVQERAARLLGVRPVPRAAPGVLRARDVHRAADAVADRRAAVRRVPRGDRGARRGRQPPPRHARLDADPAEAARRPRGGDGRLQALRRAARQRDVRRHEPRRQGGADRQRARGRLDPLGEHRRARGARRVRAVGQPVRHPGAGRLDLRGADDGPGRRSAGARTGWWRSSPRATRATGSTSSSRTSARRAGPANLAAQRPRAHWI